MIQYPSMKAESLVDTASTFQVQLSLYNANK